MSRRRLNINTPGFVHHPSPPLRSPSQPVYSYHMPGFEHCDGGLEPHIEFHFQRRLREELVLRNPEQPFPGDPLPEEEVHSVAVEKAPVEINAAGIRVITLYTNSPQQKARREAQLAAEREDRYRKIQAAFLRKRMDGHIPMVRGSIKVAAGGPIDPTVIEDREYALHEVVGAESQFRFRLIVWGGGSTRTVHAQDKSLVLVLGGYPRNRQWHKTVTDPATRDCEAAIRDLRQPQEDIDAKLRPALSGGVGDTFNEPIVPTPPYGHVLNALVFFQLFSTLAMKRLAGYGSILLQIYCKAAHSRLQAQKEEFLKRYPEAMYPSDTSVYSAATFDFGAPRRTANPTATKPPLGACLKGGHIILWDLGLVITFPAGASILIPTGLVRYSFVRVRPGESRYSLLQWAGAGMGRWFENGQRTDADFGARATREEHDTREAQRRTSNATALDAFPIEGDLPEHGFIMPFVGTNPDAAHLAK
ncbi:hypothetical protein C8R47DRAFT_1084721 [Mycena vitilis]|nr:hypothetical protein C8R47DRAFT_1084721 [Mycena vitilis]